MAYTYDAAENRTAVGVSYPPPGAAAGSMSVPFGGSASLALPVSGQFTGAAVDTAPTKGSVTISGTTATYIASGSNYGSDSFAYRAVGQGGSSPATASVNLGLLGSHRSRHRQNRIKGQIGAPGKPLFRMGYLCARPAP